MVSSSSAVAADPFGQAYFERYYANRETRVSTPADSARICRFIAAYAEMIECRVTHVLDVGAGTGRFRRPLMKLLRDARYTGIDVSEYACAKYGWQHRSIVDLERGSFDLVLCHDVLQYLDNRLAERAIERLGERCRGLLYFSALTSEDWEQNCDQSLTDRAVHVRKTRWYRQRLGRTFRNLGGGMFAHRDAPLVTYSLHAVD